MSLLCGVLLLNKPSGPTSHDMVAAVRRAAKQRSVGHAGTLDPLADGLLLVCLGPATRISEYLAGHDKSYAVEAKLGASTDTYDAEGRIIKTAEGCLPGDAAIAATVMALTGEIEQLPPAYSAVKCRGKPLYYWARQGTEIEAAPRKVQIFSIKWERPAPDILRLHVHCSAGTYIRSLINDLGTALGCGAYVTKLSRLSSGPFSLTAAWELNQALAHLTDGNDHLLLDIAQALPDLPKVKFEPEILWRLTCGQRVPVTAVPMTAQPHLAVDDQGRVVALLNYLAEEQAWQPRKVFTREIDQCSTLSTGEGSESL